MLRDALLRSAPQHDGREGCKDWRDKRAMTGLLLQRLNTSRVAKLLQAHVNVSHEPKWERQRESVTCGVKLIIMG
jgi:hypothetical protein